MFRSVVRGKFRQLRRKDGSKVLVRLYGCVVDKAPYPKNGKTYVSFDTSDVIGDADVVRAVDEHVHAEARPAFSPVWTNGLLVVKVPAGVEYLTVDGGPGPAYGLARDDVVDVELEPGAFGDFGYCWLLRKVKPSTISARGTGAEQPDE